ncbi:MAG: hypothetical protein AAB403_12860 [Planctomycetota bacterium]
MKSTVEIIGLDARDLDRPLCRIYPLWFFEAALRTNGGNLALVSPSLWEDPHEDPCASAAMTILGSGQQALQGYLQPAFAQSWSFNGQSDALLRAYSRVSIDPVLRRNVEPRFEGVKVRTSPRRLIAALKQFQEQHAASGMEYFLAKVRYVDSPSQEIANRLNQIGPKRIGTGLERAVSLSVKRMYFAHEQEVRIIALAPHGRKEPVFFVDIRPNEVFEEVSFDPRLIAFERMERTAQARQSGYSGPVTLDGSYQGALFEIVLEEHWDTLDARP